jgi:hypothetical protein
MNVYIKTKYTDGEVELKFGYYSNGSIAIKGYSTDGLHECVFIATVALSTIPAPGFVFLKGWSENEGLPEALVKAGIVELTGKKIPTGYCEAQEAKLLVDIK